MNSPSRYRHKGIGSLIAGLFIIMIIISFIAAYMSIQRIETEYSKKIMEEFKEQSDILGINIDIIKVEVTSSGELNLTVENTGSVPVIIRYIGVFEKNTRIGSYYNASLFGYNTRYVLVDPGSIETNITTYETLSQNLTTGRWIIQLIGEDGVSLSTQYPQTVSNISVSTWLQGSYAPSTFPAGSKAALGQLTTVEYQYPNTLSVYRGTYVSGDINSVRYNDIDYYVVDSGSYPSKARYNPDTLNILQGSLSGGGISDVYSNDGVYLMISSQPYTYTNILYLHENTYTVSGSQFYKMLTIPANDSGTYLTTTVSSDAPSELGRFIYKLDGITLSPTTWNIYYRGYFNVTGGSYWRYRKAIQITEQTGNTLTNYQVKIELTTTNFDFTKAKSDGGDIRFTDSTGNLLDYWIQYWNSTSGNAIIWVKIPTIPAGSTTTIYMYYGNPSASSQSSLLNVIEPLPSSDGAGYKIYYEEWIMPSSRFTTTGNAMGWYADDYTWTYNLPFTFPYYSSSYSSIGVCSNGFIGTTYTGTDGTSTLTEFTGRGMIAPFWADLATYAILGGDIFINNTYVDDFGSGVYIRWRTTFYVIGGTQNFAAVLYQNGLIRFDYGSISGSSITDDTPVIGISYGDASHYTISTYNGVQYPSNYASVMFWPRKMATTEPTVAISTEERLPKAAYSIDVSIVDSLGVETYINTSVATAPAYRIESTSTASFNFPGYTSSPGDYLVVTIYFKLTDYLGTPITIGYLSIDNSTLPDTLQTRIEIGADDFPDKHIASIEFIGDSNTAPSWINLTWGADINLDKSNVNITLQLYNFTAGVYQTSGSGYFSTIYTTRDTDVYLDPQAILSPDDFRNSTGYWQFKITTTHTTVFNEKHTMKIDYIHFNPAFNTQSTGVQAEISLPAQYTSIVRYNVTIRLRHSVDNLNINIYAYNWSGSSWSTIFTGSYTNFPSETQYETSISTLVGHYLSGGKLLLRIESIDPSASIPSFTLYLDLIEVSFYISNIDVIYVGKGGDSSFYLYKPGIDTWSTLTGAPFLWDNYTAITYVNSQGKVYVADQSSLYAYDILTDSWSLVSTLPIQTDRGASLVYLSGYPYKLIYMPGGVITSVYQYDILTDTWTVITTLPETLTEYSIAIGLNETLYLLIGGTSDGFYMYNLTSGTWTALSNLPASKIIGAAYAGGYIYIIDNGGGVHRYTIATNSWTPMTPKVGIYISDRGNHLVSSGDKLYLVRMDYTSEIYYIEISSLSEAV